MIPYLDRIHLDNSQITLEYFKELSEIPYVDNTNAIPLHQHDFYEMVLVLCGTCSHYYRDIHIPLIPGDLFIIPPNQPHSYQFRGRISLCNCQFYKSILNASPEYYLDDIEYLSLQQNSPARKRLRELQAFQKDEPEFFFSHSGDINSQGIIHLERNEREFIQSLFFQILNEQKHKSFQSERLKQLLLEQILIQIKRVQVNQFEHSVYSITWKDKMIDSILSHIEENVAYPYDFNKIAASQNITTSYFRSIFKSITGLSPIEYLNRVRMLRALELLQTTSMPVSEIAEKVGINDPNYFSRLFKQIIGYPPRYFKSIPEL